MLLRQGFLSILLLLVRLLLAAAAQEDEMSMGRIGSEMAPAWIEKGNLEKGRPFELATLEDMAHKYWNWVVKQDNSRTEERVENGREVGGACIVAVFGDRKSRKFTAATIPRSLNKNLLRDGPNKAPVWFNGAKNEGRIKENGEGLLHAEDFALFLWEAESNSGESISRTQNKYLDNPIMAVWGETGRHAGDLKDDIPPCKQCRRILDALGVGYKNHNAGRSSPEYSGPEDEDMLEAGDCDENNQQNEENDQQSHDSDSTEYSGPNDEDMAGADC